MDTRTSTTVISQKNMADEKHDSFLSETLFGSPNNSVTSSTTLSVRYETSHCGRLCIQISQTKCQANKFWTAFDQFDSHGDWRGRVFLWNHIQGHRCWGRKIFSCGEKKISIHFKTSKSFQGMPLGALVKMLQEKKKVALQFQNILNFRKSSIPTLFWSLSTLKSSTLSL